jgi:broad specificity phosphatase PhoE
MKITFIRHSKTKVEPEKPIVLWGLAEEGIEKARALSGQDSVKRLDVIYSSLQTKAIETMVYLAKPNAIPMRTHADLTEVTSFTNKFYTGEEYTSQIERYYARTLERIAGGETIDEVLSRFMAALDWIVAEESAAENIGIVSHGNILALFTGLQSEADPYELHRTIQQPDVAEFDWNTKQFTRMWGE